MIQKDYFFKKTVEDSVKEHICLNAPVIMGLKPAAIFTVTKAEKEILEEIFSKDSDLFIETLYSGTKDSILLYRKDLMERQLAQKKIKRFLSSLKLGYLEGENSLCRFKERFRRYKEEGEIFPHEVGVFLGYPLWDIRAFIETPEKKAQFTGYWKVYFDPEGALKRFRLFDQCIKEFMDMAKRSESLSGMVECCLRQAQAA